MLWKTSSEIYPSGEFFSDGGNRWRRKHFQLAELELPKIFLATTCRQAFSHASAVLKSTLSVAATSSNTPQVCALICSRL